MAGPNKALLCLVVALALLHGAAAWGKKYKTFTVYECIKYIDYFTPNGTRLPKTAHGSPGSTFLWSNDLLKTSRAKKEIGIAHGACIDTFGTTEQCGWTMSFGKIGTLSLAGQYLYTASTTFAIVGGTGIFVGASGYLVQTANILKNNYPTEFKDVVYLLI